MKSPIIQTRLDLEDVGLLGEHFPGPVDQLERLPQLHQLVNLSD
jgi:hypothetical protein